MKNNSQEMNKIKTLIIAGTMKGGTTALFDFIATHSKVLRGSKKEIHYFSLYNHLGEEWYLDHFGSNTEDKEYIIDASPTYFDLVTSNIIPNQIKKFDKNAKVIIITRDPVSRAVSHLRHLQKVNNIESLVDLSPNEFFAQDFTQSITRTSNKEYHLNQILFFSAYYRKALIYKNEFPSDQLLFLSNDELKNKPEETMDKVFSFMDLEYENNEIFHDIRHSNKSNIDDLDEDIYKKLANLLYPDYDLYSKLVKIDTIKTIFKLKTEGRIENEVLVGIDNWLYLYGGTNEVFKYYTEASFFTSQHVEDWYSLLQARKMKLNNLNIEYIHLFVPDKISVYPEYLGVKFKYFSSHPIKKLYESYNNELNDFTVNPLPYFKKRKIEDPSNPLFYKTDTHWTFYGALAAFQLILSKLQLKLPSYFNYTDSKGKELLLDLGGKLSNKPMELYVTKNFAHNAERFYSNSLVKYKEKYSLENTEGLHVGSNVIFRNNHPNVINKRVVIFGDSFSEYRTHLLTGLFAETFSEVHFVWSVSLDYDYIDNSNPDIVISEIAERFMKKIPNDDFILEKYIMKTFKGRE